jgi:Leucine-rich repeat (LRR) protein
MRKTLLNELLSLALLFGVSTNATAQMSEREIAEWVIRQGGRVILESEREGGKPIGDVARLPAGEVRIIGVDLVGTLIEPKELEKISGLTGLKELYLPGPSWNPGAGSRLDANEELKFLSGLKNLEKLHFSLHFLTNVNVQDKGIAHLTGLTKLREFRCAQCRIAKLSLAPLAKLESLDLSLTPFNNEGMKGLAELKALRRLNLRDTLVTDEGLKYLSGFTQLQELDLSGAKITDAGLAWLRNLTAMRKLNLLGAQITDASADALAGMARLQELNLYRSRITNAGLAKLGRLKELISLDLRYSRVTATGIEAFRGAAPNCKVNFVNALATRVKNAATDRPAGTSAEAIATWIKALGGEAEISGAKALTVSLAATGISDAQLAHLSSLTELETLDLEATEIGDLGLAAIKGLTGLKSLNLSHTTVSDNGLAHLAGLPKLQELRLASALTRGPGLVNLKALPALVKLDLSGAPIGAEGLRQIAEIPTLEHLSLSSTDISEVIQLNKLNTQVSIS